MKKFYFRVAVALVFIAAFSPHHLEAQCTCAAGVPATAIVYNTNMDSLTTIVGTVSFPKFDPSIGTLSCIDVNYRVTSVLSFTLTNILDTARIYKFNYTQYSGLDDGNGLSVNNSVTRSYGPYLLGAHGSTVVPLDSIAVGPDTLFNNVFYDATTSYVAPYLGAGTIDLTYDNSYSTHFTAGSNNFDLQVRGYAKGPFTLTYYWCPASVLAKNLTNFTATRKNNQVYLQWQAFNDQNNSRYEVQYSKDGVHYFTVGQKTANASAAGTVSEYDYQYDLNSTDLGKLYFRIRKVDPDGKASFSEVKTVNLNSGAQGGLQTWPNP